jgi:hypothetical protein
MCLAAVAVVVYQLLLAMAQAVVLEPQLLVVLLVLTMLATLEMEQQQPFLAQVVEAEAVPHKVLFLVQVAQEPMVL